MHAPILIALGWLVLAPEPVAAWGPATHVALGKVVLGSLYLVPPALRALLALYPREFLYGSIAADISFAKKYVPEGRHCHNWSVGEEILGAATTPQLQAVGYGYLAHLAADTVAHNVFVPRQLLLTSTTQAIGHTYWEHRMDLHVGEEFLVDARSLVVDHDHGEADALFDSVLSRTLFSFQTNRRIFRGMIRFQGHDRRQKIFEQVLQKSRFDLPDELVDSYFEVTFDAVIAYLVERADSLPAQSDPVGAVNLKLAKMVRRRALADHTADHPEVLREMADAFFEFPTDPLRYWPQVEDPAFKGGVTARRSARRSLLQAEAP